MSVLANSMLQFLLNRLWIYIKLLVSTDNTSFHELSSQFGLAFFKHAKKNHNNYREDRASRMYMLNVPATQVTMRSRLNRQRPVWAATTAGTGLRSGDRLSKNSEKQQFKTATMRVYTCTARHMWFRNYFVAYAPVVCVQINNEELFF